MELLVDFHCKNMALMREKALLEEWLLDMAKKIGMTPHGEPKVEDYPLPDREGTALSGVVFLGESSITIHTYPEFQRVFLNVFSCKDFSIAATRAYIERTFRVTSSRAFAFQRGIDMRTGRLLPFGPIWP